MRTLTWSGTPDGVRESLLLLQLGPRVGSGLHHDQRWIYVNGHESAKAQCEKAGIDYESLDNGLRSCAKPKTLQA